MKKNILVKTGTRTEQRECIIPATYDEEGNILTPESVEMYEVEVPIMESQYVEMTDEEIAAMQPSAEESARAEAESLRHYLAGTDYVACKIAEGAATVNEYADVIAQRQAARERINELEAVK